MLKKLIRYNLNYKKAVLYAKEQLEIDYAFSKELSFLNFEKGQFFTLLPENVEMNRINDFSGGLVLPQNETKPKLDDVTGEVKGYYTWTPNVTEEIGFLISKAFDFKNDCACIFEDVHQEMTDPHIDFFNKFGFSCLNQMYYFLSNKDASPELISHAMREVDALWHQLFIVTKVELDFINHFQAGQEITLDKLKKFIANIQLLILGAYDGEGYFFWEPSGVPLFHSVSMQSI